MSDRPVSQVVVYGNADAHERERVHQRLQRIGAVDTVQMGAWILATFPLRYTVVDAPEQIAAGVGFVEGRDRLTGPPAVLAESTRKASETLNGILALPGDISAAIISQDSATIFRSCAGVSHWYVHSQYGEIIAASQLRLIPEALDRTFTYDEFVLAANTIDSLIPYNRSPLVGISVLPAGHRCLLRLGHAPEIGCYWDPAAIGQTNASFADRAVQLRETVVAHLNRELSTDRANLVTLSGGVDSSVVAAMAVRTGRTVSSVSLLPTADFDDPRPTIEALDRFLAQVPISSPIRLTVDEHSSIALLLDAPGCGVPVLNPTLAAAAIHGPLIGASVFTGGECADELFGGWNTIYEDWIPALSARELPVMLLRANRRLSPRHALYRWRNARRRPSRLPLPFPARPHEWLRPDLREEYRTYVSEVRRSMEVETGQRAAAVAMLRHYTGWLQQSWELCSATQMRRSLPFCHREAIELALATPARQLAWPPKRLLRAAFHGAVPTSNLHRIDKDAAGNSPLSKKPLRLRENTADIAKRLIDPARLNPDESLDPRIVRSIAATAAVTNSFGALSMQSEGRCT
jgi:asparagine synthetase B (glutamine-hydrolysing)